MIFKYFISAVAGAFFFASFSAQSSSSLPLMKLPLGTTINVFPGKYLVPDDATSFRVTAKGAKLRCGLDVKDGIQRAHYVYGPLQAVVTGATEITHEMRSIAGPNWREQYFKTAVRIQGADGIIIQADGYLLCFGSQYLDYNKREFIGFTVEDLAQSLDGSMSQVALPVDSR